MVILLSLSSLNVMSAIRIKIPKTRKIKSLFAIVFDLKK
jgi:hypothetical protein